MVIEREAVTGVIEPIFPPAVLQPSKEETSDIPQPDFAQIGFELFINASLAKPASVTAQAAWMVLELRDRFPDGIPPFYINNLREALVADEIKIGQIVSAGKSQHEKKKSDVEELTPERVTKMINADFKAAEAFYGVLSDEFLKEIMEEIYPYYFRISRDPRTGKLRRFPEDFIRAYAEDMLRGKKILRPWRESNPQPGA